MTSSTGATRLVSGTIVSGLVAMLLAAPAVSAQVPAAGTRELSAIQRFDLSATVEAIDKGARTLTVKGDGGTTLTMDVPREARNFDQIEVGDRVRATYMDALALTVRKPGAPITGSETKVVRVAPVGDKPSATEIRTRDLTATITAIDPGRRLVTLRGPRGNSRTIHVDPDVELAGVNVGDDVEVRYTEATVITVERAPR